ncbi:MAG: hypothetical protein Q8J88_18595 [Bacteroidales bacterium]|nr:hypothetical protein [Bacteroidales bacterium]
MHSTQINIYYFYAVLKILQSTGILLFVTLFLLQSGFGLFLHLRKEAVRNEVKQKYLEGFVGDDLIFLEIPLQLENEKNNLFKRIHSKEFVYLGQMYDIVEQERVGNVTWYLVYPDKKETSLKKQMKNLMDDYDRHSGQRSADQHLLKWILFFDSSFVAVFLPDKDLLTSLTNPYIFAVKEWITPSEEHPPCLL